MRIAIMPQQMSTPTAAGMIASTVGITLPTVAPVPQCTSGIAATPEHDLQARDVLELVRLVMAGSAIQVPVS